jgi:myo-inositol-1(or 4)-monophosphatase
MRRESLQIESTKSTEFDVVTNADIACEELLRAEISRARPQDGILGEEAGMVDGSSGLTWVIDPIDGTTNFLYGLPHWSVSVAVVAGQPDDPARWRPIASSVYLPDLATQYDAGWGQGASRNGAVIRPPDAGKPGRASELRAALLAVGFHYDPDARRRQADVAARLSDQVRDLRDHGATSLELCLVADGSIDGYWEERVSPWDAAGGLLVAEETGCAIRWQHRDGALGREIALLVCGQETLLDSLSSAVAGCAAV